MFFDFDRFIILGKTNLAKRYAFTVKSEILITFTIISRAICWFETCSGKEINEKVIAKKSPIIKACAIWEFELVWENLDVSCLWFIKLCTERIGDVKEITVAKKKLSKDSNPIKEKIIYITSKTNNWLKTEMNKFFDPFEVYLKNNPNPKKITAIIIFWTWFSRSFSKGNVLSMGYKIKDEITIPRDNENLRYLVITPKIRKVSDISRIIKKVSLIRVSIGS